MKVIDASKVLPVMRTVTRDDVNAPYSRCVDCDCKTRSHVLEPAEYEIYTEEVIVGPLILTLPRAGKMSMKWTSTRW